MACRVPAVGGMVLPPSQQQYPSLPAGGQAFNAAAAAADADHHQQPALKRSRDETPQPPDAEKWKNVALALQKDLKRLKASAKTLLTLVNKKGGGAPAAAAAAGAGGSAPAAGSSHVVGHQLLRKIHDANPAAVDGNAAGAGGVSSTGYATTTQPGTLGGGLSGLLASLLDVEAANQGCALSTQLASRSRSLHGLLQNIHTLQLARCQLSDPPDAAGNLSSAAAGHHHHHDHQLVCDFVSETLVSLPPSDLRQAYVRHSAVLLGSLLMAAQQQQAAAGATVTIASGDDEDGTVLLGALPPPDAVLRDVRGLVRQLLLRASGGSGGAGSGSSNSDNPRHDASSSSLAKPETAAASLLAPNVSYPSFAGAAAASDSSSEAAAAAAEATLVCCLSVLHEFLQVPSLGQLVMAEASRQLDEVTSRLCRSGGSATVTDHHHHGVRHVATMDDLAASAADFERAGLLMEVLGGCLKHLGGWCTSRSPSAAAMAAAAAAAGGGDFPGSSDGTAVGGPAALYGNRVGNTLSQLQVSQHQHSLYGRHLAQHPALHQSQARPGVAAAVAAPQRPLLPPGCSTVHPGYFLAAPPCTAVHQPTHPPSSTSNGNSSFLTETVRHFISVYSTLPQLLDSFPLFTRTFVTSMATLSAALQHVAAAPELAAAPRRAECRALCAELRRAFMPPALPP